MKVYLAYSGDYDCRHVIGVYRSGKKAQSASVNHNKGEGETREMFFCDPDVEEFELIE